MRNPALMSSAIRVDNLRHRYGRSEVLNGISFEIQRGQVTALLGPNGAGKSTTLKILTGILPASEGLVQVDGLELPERAFEVKQRIGYVPESADLYESLSALEFLELCGRLHDVEDVPLRSRIDALLVGFGLAEKRNLRLGSYSKGMRQKVMISAALLHNPNVIILDEPLTSLDVESAIVTKSLLASLAAEGKTILYSSHVPTLSNGFATVF